MRKDKRCYIYKKKLDFKLKKFSRNAFFKRTKLILLLVLRKKNSAQVLANFIASYIKILKKDLKFFLKFLKKNFKTNVK